jgi:ABC-type sulfate/molybdate transport systems ATPase subunit
VLLLDEPLSALDTHTRATVRSELHALLAELDLPALLVTHDYEDAAALASRVGVLVDGKLRQFATPQELVATPSDAFVASFTGANVVRGRVVGAGNGLTRVRLESGDEVWSTDAASGDVEVVVYPWEISVGLVHRDDSALNVIRGHVSSLVPVGNRARVTIGPLTAEVTERSAQALGLAVGAAAYVSFKATGTRLMRA